MPLTDYHKKIVDYYEASENAYKDTWDLDNSLAIHYGYWDKNVRSFRQSLARMNEIMLESAAIKNSDLVLDAGCGIGGSSFFIAERTGCKVAGIGLSEKQIARAKEISAKKGLAEKVVFGVMDYCQTSFPDKSFDVVWGCESICYAEDKEKFVKEASRILKTGGRLVIADGFVKKIENNQHPVIRNWLDGWQVNYLETMGRFCQFMHQYGFTDIRFKDISKNVARSSSRLYRYYYLANLYFFWKKMTFSDRATDMQKKNIRACKYQYLGLKKKLWEYGLIVGVKQ